jgi:outer membrane protein
MKRLVKLSVVIVIVLSTMNVVAQSKLKLGYINSDSLMLIMPGIDSANSLLKTEYKAYQSKLETMQTELNTKWQAYIKDSVTMLPSIKALTMAEMQDLNTRIKTFSASADSTFKLRRVALIKPLQEKALKAIEDVAKENGYTYIFDSALGTLLFKTESFDIMPFVKKKLGIK